MPKFAIVLDDCIEAATHLKTQDNAAVKLARKYAALLDEWDGMEGEEEQFATLGPKLLNCLSALGLTPKGRMEKAQEGGSANDPASAALDELEQRRRTRADRAATVDASSS